jgi:hypothetical protein
VPEQADLVHGGRTNVNKQYVGGQVTRVHTEDLDGGKMKNQPGDQVLQVERAGVLVMNGSSSFTTLSRLLLISIKPSTLGLVAKLMNIAHR